MVAGTLNRKIKGIGIFRTVLFLPLAVSSVVMAVVWQFVFNTDNGLLNIMLGWIGIGPVPWLIDPKWAMVSLCLVSVWKSVPFATVVLLAAMQGVPKPSTRRQKSMARERTAVLLDHRAVDSRRALVRGGHLNHQRVPGV